MKVYIVFEWYQYSDNGPDVYAVYDSKEKADAMVEKFKESTTKAQKLKDEYDELAPYLEALRATSPNYQWRVLEVVTIEAVLDI